MSFDDSNPGTVKKYGSNYSGWIIGKGPGAMANILAVGSADTAVDTIMLDDGAQMFVLGGVVRNTTVSGGVIQMSSGASITSTNLCSDGAKLLVRENSIIDTVNIVSGAAVTAYESWINDASVAGFLYVSSGGGAKTVTLTDNGRVRLGSGSYLEDAELYGVAQLQLYNGAILSGGIDIYENAVVTFANRTSTGVVASDASITVHLADRDITAGAVFQYDISNQIVGGDFIFDVTDAGLGSYIICSNSTAFTGSFSVVANDMMLGTVEVGNPLGSGVMVYSLTQATSYYNHATKSYEDVLLLNMSVLADVVDWPLWWSETLDAPLTAKVVGSSGVVGAAHRVSDNTYAARTDPGSTYSSVAFDYSVQPDATFFARISGGVIGTFKGGDFDNRIYMTDGAVGTLYGGVGTETSNLIEIGGGSVDTLYGGGDSGGVGAQVLLTGGTFSNVYGGGEAGYCEDVWLFIEGGVINRLRCGATAEGAVGDVYAEITGGTITGQIVGGGLGDAKSVSLNLELDPAALTGAYIYGGSIGGDISEHVVLNITGGSYQGIIVAGSRAAGSGASASVEFSINLNISDAVTHISNSKAIAAGVDTAWIFAGQAVTGGSFTGGIVNMGVAAGAAVKYLVGGAMADGEGSVASVTDVVIGVKGASVTGGIWGAGYSYNGGVASAMSVEINIDAGDDDYVTAISGNIYTGGIVLGGAGEVSYDSGKVFFSGSGANLDFSRMVSGGGATTASTLIFEDFTGGFNGTIVGFDRVAFTGDTSVDVRNTYADCTELVFDLSWRTVGEAFVTSMDSFGFTGNADNYIGFVLDTSATGEIVTELMGVSDLSSLEGVNIALLDSYDDAAFYASFGIGELYSGDGFEFMVDYDSGSGVLYSWFSATS